MRASQAVRLSGLHRIVLIPLTFLFLLLTLTLSASAQARTEVTGRVLDASTGRGIEAANVNVGSTQAITDTQGRFRLMDAPVGA